MKKTTQLFAVITLLAAAVFTGCKSPEDKVEAAEDKVENAKDELKEEVKDANADAVKKANAEEWAEFKAKSNEEIKENEKKIAELRVKLKKPGKMLDPIYEKRIASLEEKNRNLKIKLDAYETNQSDWEAFKAEFKHDMEEFGNAFKSITVDNEK